MSSIMIHDIAHSSALDSTAMSAVRGGSSWGEPNVNVNVNINQQIAQFQNIGVNVLNNNGVIGADFSGPDVAVKADLWAKNEAVLPKF